MKPSQVLIRNLFLALLVLISCTSKKENLETNDTHNPQTKKIKKLTAAEKRIKEQEEINKSNLNKYIHQKCDESTAINLQDLQFSLLKDYLYSSVRTNKKDGKSFCLHEIYNNNNAVSRIVYERTKGGPYGDIISIWSLNKTTKQLWQYHLFSEFNKGGYHQKVSTKIEAPFTLVITEIVNSKTKVNEKTVNKFKLFENGDVGL